MNAIWLAIIGALKNIFLKVVSEKFFEWLFFWSAKALVDSTKTTKDNEFYDKAKELFDAH